MLIYIHTQCVKWRINADSSIIAASVSSTIIFSIIVWNMSWHYRHGNIVYSFNNGIIQMKLAKSFFEQYFWMCRFFVWDLLSWAFPKTVILPLPSFWFIFTISSLQLQKYFFLSSNNSENGRDKCQNNI